jgi:hypothetical protein
MRLEIAAFSYLQERFDRISTTAMKEYLFYSGQNLQHTVVLSVEKGGVVSLKRYESSTAVPAHAAAHPSHIPPQSQEKVHISSSVTAMKLKADLNNHRRNAAKPDDKIVQTLASAAVTAAKDAATPHPSSSSSSGHETRRGALVPASAEGKQSVAKVLADVAAHAEPVRPVSAAPPQPAPPLSSGQPAASPAMPHTPVAAASEPVSEKISPPVSDLQSELQVYALTEGSVCIGRATISGPNGQRGEPGRREKENAEEAGRSFRYCRVTLLHAL